MTSTYWLIQALVGALLWSISLPFLPAPSSGSVMETWIPAFNLFAALVLVPLVVRFAVRSDEQETSVLFWRLAQYAHFPAGLLLVVAYMTERGNGAAGFAFFYAVVTILLSAIGFYRILTRSQFILSEMCFDLGLIALALAGGWTLMDRWGTREAEDLSLRSRALGYSIRAIEATAIYLHYAGFMLLAVVGLLGKNVPIPPTRYAGLIVLVSVPLVAVAVALESGDAFEVAFKIVAALFLIAGAGLTALFQANLFRRFTWPWFARVGLLLGAIGLVAGTILFGVGLVGNWRPILAIGYAVLALAFGVPTLIGWSIATSEGKVQTSTSAQERYGVSKPPRMKFDREEPTADSVADSQVQ